MEKLKSKFICILLIVIYKKLLERIKILEAENKKNIALIEFQKGYIDAMKSK